MRPVVSSGLSAFIFSFGVQVADAQSIAKTFGNWKLKCEVNKMTDKRQCQIELPLDPEVGSTGPRIGAGLMTLDLGSRFLVMTGVPPVAAQVRIDKHKHHAMICSQVCVVSEPDRMKAELSGGTRILAIIATVRGNTESSVPSGSYERALEEAKRWVSGETQQQKTAPRVQPRGNP